MKDIWSAEPIEKKGINKKKLIITILIIIIIVLTVITVGVYCTDRNARDWIDRNIFRKEVAQNKAVTIELEEGQTSKIYAFNRYIGILNKTKFSIYGNTGSVEAELEVQISNPIFCSANRFLAIAEDEGQKFYIISDKEIAWEASIEGNISQIYINRNGYVAVVLSDTSHKSVIKMYDTQGKELFNTYLSSTQALDVSISNDNKYLAIAEIDTAGTMIKSNIKIMSIEEASTDPTYSLENAYESENGKLLTSIKYQDKNKLVCMYTDEIQIIEDGQVSTLISNEDKKVTFQSINLTNSACLVEEQSSGLFTANSVVDFVDVGSKEVKQYIADSVTKELYTYDNIIALNLGTEIEFVNTSGWLVKRYVANQEITNVVVSNSIAGIIYHDKIEIVNL